MASRCFIGCGLGQRKPHTCYASRSRSIPIRTALPRTKHDSPPATHAAKKGARPRTGAAPARAQPEAAPAESAEEEGAEGEAVDDEEHESDGDGEGELADDIDAVASEAGDEESDIRVPSSHALNESSSI